MFGIIILSKIVIFIGKFLNRGSNFPGNLALKLDKNILSKFKTSAKIIAVTGSSGKGTTSKMLSSILKAQGYKVLHNYRGGNLKTGILTMLLEGTNLKGQIQADYIVYEIDERYIKFVLNFWNRKY